MIRNGFVVLPWIALLLSGCSQDMLTPPTSEGNNTFSCKIDGDIWVATGDWTTATPKLKVYRSSDTTLTIEAYQGPHPERTAAVSLTFPYPVEPTTQRLVRAGFGSNDWLPLFCEDCGGITYTTVDSARRILAGTFHFTAIDTASGLGYNVTDGRFDVHY